MIRPGTVLPEATVVPSYTIWEGNPGEDSCRILRTCSDDPQDGLSSSCLRRSRRRSKPSARATTNVSDL